MLGINSPISLRFFRQALREALAEKSKAWHMGFREWENCIFGCMSNQGYSRMLVFFWFPFNPTKSTFKTVFYRRWVRSQRKMRTWDWEAGLAAVKLLIIAVVPQSPLDSKRESFSATKVGQSATFGDLLCVPMGGLPLKGSST